MDSYNFHFERMSNLDLHPLSLPVSRLSPAKSSSSIVDQLTNHHHQHGKGDSAYSSFSGGSTAPDYPSPFLPDDLQPSSLHHYADLKYVKAIYHPHQLLQSDSKSMDQLYRSVEAISQQYRHNNNSHHKSHDDNDDGCHGGNNNPFCSQDVTPVAPSPAPPLPPPPPARLDSFIATRNLENTRAHHLGTETQRQPQPQQLSRPQSANTDPGSSDLRADLIYGGCWSSQKQPQPQPPPSYHSHHHKPQSLTPDHLFIADNTAACEQQQKPVNIRLPPPGTSQPEHQKHRRAASSGGGNGSHGDSGFEGQRKRANSAHRCPGPEPSQSVSLWNASQNLINSSIQHKGQFYFITGVCKSAESNGKTHVYPSSEAGSESPATAETHRLREREREREKEREKERCHSTMDHLFKPLQQRPHSSDDKIADESETFFTPLTQGQELASSKLQEQENHGVISNKPSTQSSRGFDALEQIPSSQSREMGRHTANHHIFYCGPAESTAQTKEAAPLSVASEQSNHYKREREEPVKRGRRQPLGDVASERINKETTPMLYHLTGAGRAPLKVSKKDIDFSMKAKEAGHNKTGHNKDAAGRNERATAAQVEAPKEGRGESGLHLCNTLDDSFKKYYKEKLKDAQSKVLRETSFKRRDLQLSWPHRIRPRPEVRPTVILHSFSSSQDSETSTETLAPSVTSEGTEEAESVKEDVVEKEKESEKENGRPANVAQPQVPRIGGRKRLTAEQKKMCFSEPEKLNQLGHGPNHSTCRSLGDEMENFFTTGSKGEDAAEQGEQGLVAARRRMFETRGRALSASNLSKTNLKHLQHKALVEYMERKTGQKVAEPQQPGPQLLPAPYSQRHSIGGKTSDSGPKRKHPRPHSAGRILDSSSSSIRYAQFFSAQSSSVQSSVYPPEPSWSERQGSSQVKSASAESLLDQPEPPSFFRNRSTSTPHAFQARGQDKDPSPVITMGTSSLQKKAEEASPEEAPPVGPAPEGQQRVRAVAQRGKSMEELGVSKLTRNPALSKSSEQLDRLWSRLSRPGVIPGTPDGEKRSVGRRGETRTRGQEAERKRKDQRGLEVMENAGQEKPQAQVETLFRQDSAGTPGSEEDAGPPATTATGDLSRSTSPASSSSSRARALSAPGPFADEVRLSRPSSEASTPPSPSGPETGEGELKSTTSSPSLPRPASRVRSSPLVTASEREQSVDEPGGEATPPDSSQEVSLSRGVTTDPSLWILPPEGGGDDEELQTPLLPDDVPEGESTSPAPPAQSSEPPASPADPVPDADQSGGQERDVEDDEGNASGDGQKTEERRGPEGETESSEKTQPGEEPRWEELVEEVVRADPSLARALYPLANRKTALMLMEQLLSEDTLLMEEHYKKKQEQRGASESSETVEDAEPSPCPSASDSQTPCAPEIHCKADVTEKKRILVSRIEERFRALEETRRALQVEIQENVARGEEVEALVRERCLPVELERYSLFIGDLERVVSLLLCLSARLARVQNALSTVDQYTDAEEMESLDNRHRLLCKQRDDAKDLKDNLDRRESVVSSFLSRQLSGEQLRFYRRFVQTKASLLIRQKDLEERQRLGEEQLEALQSGLPP